MKTRKKQNDWNGIYKILTTIFLVLLFGVYPLFNTGNYRTLLQGKTGYLYIVTGSFFFAMLLVCVLESIRNKRIILLNNYSKGSVTDYAVMAFLFISVLSWVCNGHKEDLFWGGYGRNVGLLVILSCGGIYFLSSRFGELSQGILFVMLGTMSAVSLVAIVNFLGIDLLGMYSNLQDRKEFLSTMGNVTVLSSYLAIMVATVMGLLFVAQEKMSCVVYGVITVLGLMGMFSCGTDSVYLVLGVVLVVLFFFAKQAEQGRKWLLLCGETVGALLLVCILRRVRVDACLEMSSALTRLLLDDSRSIVVSITVLFVVGTLALVCKKEKTWKSIRKFLIIMLLVCLAGLIGVMVVMNCFYDGQVAKDMLGGLGSYLYFGDDWGTKRGQIWGLSFLVFGRMSWLEKILGCGPSGYFFALQDYLTSSDLACVTVKGVLVDAHSVYLQLLIGQGLLGFVSYFMIFASSISKCIFTCERNPKVVIYILWMVSFLIQGMVNNIHIFIEPICFALLGVWTRLLFVEDE